MAKKGLRMRGTPLTIEQIKALKDDEDVWVVFKEYGKRVGLYGTVVCGVDSEELVINYHTGDDLTGYLHSDYGKTWLAYKNKESENEHYGNIEQALREFTKKLQPLISDLTERAFCNGMCMVTTTCDIPDDEMQCGEQYCAEQNIKFWLNKVDSILNDFLQEKGV